MFSCEFCEIFKNAIFTEHLWVTWKCSAQKLFWKILLEALISQSLPLHLCQKETPAQVEFLRYCKKFQSTFFTKHLKVNGSLRNCRTLNWKILDKIDNLWQKYFSLILLKVQSCKISYNKYTIVSIQITNPEIFAFIAVRVFKLLSRKVLFIIKKNNRNC